MAPLPIMVTSEFAFSTKPTLKSDDGWQHQSLLLRLLKVAAWNGLNGDELAYVFGRGGSCATYFKNPIGPYPKPIPLFPYRLAISSRRGSAAADSVIRLGSTARFT
ncbi:MAG: hypothetical protein CTY16_06205 [Methylobacter sp.]|nr:MAG: hypothetical protein CTY16_06205 [Methylobacter sp.]